MALFILTTALLYAYIPYNIQAVGIQSVFGLDSGYPGSSVAIVSG